MPSGEQIVYVFGVLWLWWLRSPRYDASHVAAVGDGGNITQGIHYSTIGGVRPALWVNLGS